MRRSIRFSFWAVLAAAATVTSTTALLVAQDSDGEGLARIEALLQSGRVIEARQELRDLRRIDDGDIDQQRVMELIGAAERRLRSMSEVEVSLQKAEVALQQGDLRLADTHARAARRHDRASDDDRARAAAVLERVRGLRAELAPMVESTLAQAVADFEGERYAEAKAGLGSIVRTGVELTQEQMALLNRYRDRLYQLERDRGEPFAAQSVPLALLRGQVAGVIAVVGAVGQNGDEADEQAPQQNDDALEQADRVDAERLMGEANAAYEAGRYNEASEKFQLLLTRYARFLDDAQLTQARDRRLDAQVRLGGQDGGALQGFQQDRSIMIQEARAEFSSAIEQAKAGLKRGDINGARNLAAQARFRWTDAFNNGLFSEEQYRAGINQVTALVGRVDQEEERRAIEQIRVRQSKLKSDEEKNKRRQESDRRARIAASLNRLRSLQMEQKYDEALEVAEQVLFLDPNNSAALLMRDVLKDVILYRAFEDIRQQQTRSYAVESLELDRAMVVPKHIMNYPPDWPELSFRRGEVQSFAESDGDRRVLAALDSRRIPASFKNNRLEDVLSFIASVTNVNVDVDWVSLNQLGIDRDTPVNLELRDVPARVVLDRVLEKTRSDPFSRADWAVNDGVLVVAAEEALRRNAFVVIYDIRDLLFQIPDFDDLPRLDLDDALNPAYRDTAASAGSMFDEDDRDTGGPMGLSEQDMMERILEIIQTNVDFGGWRDNGGSTGVIQELNGNLIITNTAKNHRQIQGLLNQLREIRSVQINVESRFLTVSQDFFEQIGFNLDLTFNAQNSQFEAVQRQLQAFGQGSLTNEGLALRPSEIADPNLRTGTNRGFTVTSVDPTTGVPTFTFQSQDFSIPAPNGFSQIPVNANSQGITDKLLGAAATGFVGTILSENPALQLAGTFLDDVQVDFLVEATQADQRNVILTAPRLTFSNGRSANISVVTQTGFVSDLTPVVGTSSVAFDPTIGRINSGFTLGVRGVASADRRYVTLTVQTSISSPPTFGEPQTITGVAGGGGGNNNVNNSPAAQGSFQIPNLNVTRVNTAVTIPDRGTVLLGGQRVNKEIEVESGVPVLSKLPIINRFFTNRAEVREEKTLMILMKPTIIIQNEREEEEFPGLLDQLKNPFR